MSTTALAVLLLRQEGVLKWARTAIQGGATRDAVAKEVAILLQTTLEHAMSLISEETS